MQTKQLLAGFRPNDAVDASSRVVYAILSLALIGLAWQLAPEPIPSIGEVLRALATLWHERGLFEQLTTSFALNAQAIALSTAITLALAYLTVLPAARSFVGAVSKLRFTGMVGWGFVLALVAHDGHQLKLWMLVFGMTPFFVTSMTAVVAEIPREQFDHARTLRMSEWRIAWDVVVRGTLDRALETLRHNAAMGWMMLTTVEGVVRSEGGIGAMMLGANQHLALDATSGRRGSRDIDPRDSRSGRSDDALPRSPRSGLCGEQGSPFGPPRPYRRTRR